MGSFWSLFSPRRDYRYFALLDSTERCQAFKHSKLPPLGNGWVEIEEIRLNWLHQPLPANARVGSRTARPRQPPMLAT